MNTADASDLHEGVAIIGMTGRFPGAQSVEELWQNLQGGVESIIFFSHEELLSSGIDPTVLRDPNYVKAGAVLKDVELFDADFFGFTPREAEIMDPQHRLFLECAWEALESAGYDPERYNGAIGVYAGARLSTYVPLGHFSSDAVSHLQAVMGNEKDYLTSRISYKLNLKGPSVCVQSACSTSLVAVHMACQGLLNGECDMALAGGVAVKIPQKAGYVSSAELTSPDGHCRAFDARAQGTVFGNGVGMVVLKRFADALADGDSIHAVIKGSAVNNDGAVKVGYMAPSVDGQASVITEALAVSGIDAETVTYIEAHGTGTPLGDPIEITALTQAFRTSTEKTGFCALGTVKTNIGHLDTAAGVAGLIKTVLALQHKLLPPSLHFDQPNPQIDFAHSPFYVNTTLAAWKAGETPRRAGVSSFGIGGTNAHVILEEPPVIEASGPSRPWQLVLLSAQTGAALETMTSNLAEHFKQHPGLNLADVAYTLQVGRKAFNHRRMLVCHDRADAVQTLAVPNPRRVLSATQEPHHRPIVFMFPGEGAQYVTMGFELYHIEPTFRAQVDVCVDILTPLLGLDLRHVLYPSKAHAEEASRQLGRPSLALPALFVIEHALATLWMSWGVHPQAMIGHSLGEYVAACLAEVISLEDALALVALRGRLFEQLPTGAMMRVSLPEQAVQPLLDQHLSLAAVNGPSSCVLAGPTEAIARTETLLAEQEVECRRLATAVAAHSELVTPIVEEFTRFVATCTLRAPRIPYVSNVTGTWMTAVEATDPHYWARHLRHTVRFGDGLRELLQAPDRMLLEVGPGQTLSILARQHPDQTAGHVVLSSLRHPHEPQSDAMCLLSTLGRLWLAGVQVEWSAFYAHERRCRVPLPTYPFERQRYWMASQPLADESKAPPASLPKKPDIADWFYLPSWKRSLPPSCLAPGFLAGQKRRWLVFSDRCGLGSRVVQRLEQEGQDVMSVLVGEAFGRVSESAYRLHPHQRDDYDALLKELRALEKIPDVIVHVWNVTSDEYTQWGMGCVETLQYVGFYSLLFLAQALGAQQLPAPLHIEVVSNHIQVVTGEEVLHPEKATMLGPCKVIPQEYPHLVCRSIDIVAPALGSAQEEELIDQLIAEWMMKPSEVCVAYRGRHRWVPIFEPVRLESKNGCPTRLREGGVYLITGGLGGMGLVLAEYLARTVQAKLTLIGRSAFPKRDDWETWLATHEAQDDVSRKIRKVQMLEELGAEVFVLSADVADQEHMQSVMTQIHERFGALHGVIHAAGIVGGGMMQLKTPEKAAGVFAPKVQGTLVLETILNNVPLDFLVLCSSTHAITGGFGQVDYCAANAFLDAFAYYYSSRYGVCTISINWDGWQDIGMAVDAMRSLGLKGIQQGSHADYRVVSHPLLDTCILATLDQEIYAAELFIAKHWVLDEHRIMGNAVIPGTAYLEMARAAFESHSKNGAIEIRNVFFTAPFIIREDEKKEARTIIIKAEDHFEFFIISGSNLEKDERVYWKEHAIGSIKYIDSEPPKKYKIEDMEKKCSEREIIVADQKRENKKNSIHPRGLRWNSLQWVKFGANQALAFLELPEAFSADLHTFKLHPALLDIATGFMMLFMDDGVYLPFSYKRLRIKGPLPARIYSYIRYEGNQPFLKETKVFDITITDEQGTELVEIEEYTLQKIDELTPFAPEAIQDKSHRASSVPANQNFRKMSPVASPVIPATRSLDNFYLISDQLSGPRVHNKFIVDNFLDLEEGMVPKEGVEAFHRVLSWKHLLSQVVVSTRDLNTLMEKTPTLKQPHLLAELEKLQSLWQTHPRPPVQNAYVAPCNAAERTLADLWQTVLGVDRVGVNDNFFELGGDSLLAMQVVSRLHSTLQVELPLQSLFEAPTVAALVKYVETVQWALQDQQAPP
jgi:acyl transferase domain-containing protein/acyl carrier protein